jgi:GMP synthase (glutamine-hydrolysing)
MKPFLILQLRPEADVSDDEYFAILAKGGLSEADTHRICLDREKLPANLDLHSYAGVIVGGGPGCVSDPPEKKSEVEAQIEREVQSLMPQIVAEDIPFMGCCYGIGVLGHHLKAEVSKRAYSEPVGATGCTVTEAGREDPLLMGLPERFEAFVGHKEALQELPEGCVHLLEGDACPYQMIRYGKNVYASQFHPEADPDVFELRIHAYRNKGYFHPDEADSLIAMCRSADVHMPERILQAFVARYRIN